MNGKCYFTLTREAGDSRSFSGGCAAFDGDCVALDLGAPLDRAPDESGGAARLLSDLVRRFRDPLPRGRAAAACAEIKVSRSLRFGAN